MCVCVCMCMYVHVCYVCTVCKCVHQKKVWEGREGEGRGGVRRMEEGCEG